MPTNTLKLNNSKIGTIMEFFSLFDFISFVVPGGTAFIFMYWAATNSTIIKVERLNLPDSLMLVLFLMISYFLGLAISHLGKLIENSFGGKPKSWVEILKNDQYLAKSLNTYCNNYFGYNFLQNNGDIDENLSEKFYGQAYMWLRVEDKLNTIESLMSQYTFLRNCTALFFLTGLGSLWVALINQSINLEVRNFALLISLLSIFSFFIAQQLSFKRRYLKMKMTLDTFNAFMIAKTNN